VANIALVDVSAGEEAGAECPSSCFAFDLHTLEPRFPEFEKTWMVRGVRSAGQFQKLE
jgi:hypothetical protein